MAWRVGVDSGGTFTDVCLFDDATGRVEVWKVASTPDDPSRGIAQGVAEGIGRVGTSAAELGYFGHGTTVATNALIQHRGVRTGLITTDGFRDLLEIGRQKRPDLYDLQADKPPVLVPRDLRLQVAERIHHDGSVETPLDHDAFRAAVRHLRDAGVKAVAVCFLYSFVRPEHEEAARRILAEEFPEAFACVSHQVAPEFREYERMSTTVVNAYLGPVMQSYIRRLGDRLTALGMQAAPHLTQSNGGVIGFDQAARLPVRTVLSGPSTGVVGAQAVGRLAGIEDLITFDMGGTSTDVALLAGGQCRLASEAVVHGYPIKAPMLDIHTVGAGGGSIAFVDNGGLLKVGPRSAGADPGPVCYGRGATEPTVTDANVVLGTLNPGYLLGGRMAVQRDLAKAAIQRLAERLGLDLYATAQGVISVVTANMARAIRVISVQRGHDPRDYTLVAFGGAGPLHAARLAKELEISRILVPRNPGILCATGLLLTDLRADFATTRLTTLRTAGETTVSGGMSAPGKPPPPNPVMVGKGDARPSPVVMAGEGDTRPFPLVMAGEGDTRPFPLVMAGEGPPSTPLSEPAPPVVDGGSSPAMTLGTRHDPSSATAGSPHNPNPDPLAIMNAAFVDLAQQADAWFEAEHIAANARQVSRTVDMRYAGQNYELAIPLPPDGGLNDLTAGFAEAHHRMYGFIAEDEPVQLVTFRLEASGLVPKATFAAQPDAGPDATPIGHREVWLPECGGFVTCPVYDRDTLRAGNRFTGPAIVEQMDATTVVLPGMAARVEPYLNLILEAA
jgi:N-methylhydantoinase A